MTHASSDDPEPIEKKAHAAFSALGASRDPAVLLAAAQHWWLWQFRDLAREALGNAEKYATEKYLRAHPHIKEAIAAMRQKLSNAPPPRAAEPSSTERGTSNQSGQTPSPVADPSKPDSINGGNRSPAEPAPAR
jgi:hypothetical protein